MEACQQNGGKGRLPADGEVCFDTDKRSASGLALSSATGLIASPCGEKRFPVAEAGQKRHPG